VRPPWVGATVIDLDPQSVENLPGNPQVVRVNNFVGIVADSEWEALQAAGALQVTWSEGVTLPAQLDFYDYLRQQPSQDRYTVLTDGVDRKCGEAASIRGPLPCLTPYQMHGAVRTSCAVGDVQGSGPNGTATSWSATQGVYPQRDSVSLVLGIPKENIEVIFVEGSGCYGLKGADTVTYDAALLSQAVGKPVRVQLTRKDEMQGGGGNYGPASLLALRS